MCQSPCPRAIGEFIGDKDIHKSKFDESSIFGLERLLPFPLAWSLYNQCEVGALRGAGGQRGREHYKGWRGVGVLF